MESNPEGLCTSSSTNTQHPYNVESSATYKMLQNEMHREDKENRMFRFKQKEK